jgi:cinnamyl-alcohol dehydrogenase
MMKHNMNQPGKSLGVVGLGGLGHMAVKFGKAFGLKATVISTSESKRKEALTQLGADRFIISKDEEQMGSAAKSLDFIIDTASGDHPFDPYLSLLKCDGIMVLVGFPSEIKISPFLLNRGGRCIAGSISGGMKDRDDMIEFCAKNNIYPDVEIISIEYINEALEKLAKSEASHRFVIDVANTLK